MKPTITYDDFLKLDIRVGQITKAEPVPKSEKLLRLEVDFGAEVGSRVILAGIAKQQVPSIGASYDELCLQCVLVGLSIVAVLNLAPRKMMGIESHGMLLAGSNENGLELVQCAMPPGVEIG